ncbi:Outer membrane efflux protein [Algoriphagus locisalis]|uniref:Outer membrane efflux protein n=1 Tax=Algoriphagus locisalis TaxID=305507 RepID=A0A1I7CK81_9BACT|nr:TolC family protein [Algoriphagus locisalis]SFT99840.1 Outer membrane efflux protein [Algoriphagus locisalis]
MKIRNLLFIQPAIILIVVLTSLDFAIAQETKTFTLKELVQQAKDGSPVALRAKTRRENRYWQYRLFRSNYNPQLRLTGTIPQYYQEFNNITQPDGSIEFIEVKQNLMDLGLGLEQVIGATGGTVSVNTSTNRFDNFLSNPGQPQTRYSGVPISVALNQPIFAFNPYKWDKKIEPLLYEESKREYVKEMEEVSIYVTQLYFDYLIAQVNSEIAATNLRNTEDIFAIEKRRNELGVTPEDDLLQVELQVLNAQQAAAQAEVDLESAAFAMNSFIGLNQSSNLNLVSPVDIPEFEVNVEQAIDLAFQNRAEAIGYERQKTEAESQVAQARGQRFQVLLNARYGYNNAAFNFPDIYQNPNTQALVSLGLSVPILDWGRNKARMSMAMANQELVENTVAQELINFEQEIFTQVKNFMMIKERLKVTRVSDDVAQRRYDIALKRYQTGNVTITNLNIAQNEKDSNKRAFYTSLREFWMAYYELRSLTLYDFENDELLYIPEME